MLSVVQPQGLTVPCGVYLPEGVLHSPEVVTEAVSDLLGLAISSAVAVVVALIDAKVAFGPVAVFLVRPNGILPLEVLTNECVCIGKVEAAKARRAATYPNNQCYARRHHCWGRRRGHPVAFR